MFKSYILSFLLIVVTFSGCGGGSSSSSVSLENKLKSKVFYGVENSIYNTNLYKITFDSNLSSWKILTFQNNYSSESISTFENNISVTGNILENIGGYEYIYDPKTLEYIDLRAKKNSLVFLKLFNSPSEAENFHNKSLSSEVLGKSYFVVQNDFNSRSLFKSTFSNDGSTWDLLTYDGNYSNQTSTSLDLNIAITDNNLTTNNGSSFALNSINREFIQLASTSSYLVTLKLFAEENEAIEYYNSKDLRKEVKNKTFYAVSSSGDKKTRFKFTFTEDLTNWDIEIYALSFDEVAFNNAQSVSVLVTEDSLTDAGDSLYYESKTDDYIFLTSKTSSNTFRFYTSKDLAEAYFKE